MEFRDFEIEEHDENTIVIIQSDHNGGEDRIFLDKKQLQFFVDAIIGVENLNVGYIADVQFKELPQMLKVVVDSPTELGQLHNDIEMAGFGVDCKLDDSSRILYKLED